MTEIMVTGINGLLGRALANRLKKNNYNHITGVSRTRGSEIAEIDYKYGDLAERGFYEELPENIDICVHTAAEMPHEGSFTQQERLIRTNIMGTYRLLEHLLNRSPQVYFIQISTIYVYKPGTDEPVTEEHDTVPGTNYGRSKLYSEALVRESGLRTCILRMSSFYDAAGKARANQGLLYDWIEKAAAGIQLNVWSGGAGKRNYLYIDDAVDAVEKVINSKQEGVFNIASEENYSAMEIASKIIQEAGKNAGMKSDPGKSLYSPFAQISIDRARENFGFKPRTTLTRGIAAINDYKKINRKGES